jgi:hypothetical protein
MLTVNADMGREFRFLRGRKALRLLGLRPPRACDQAVVAGAPVFSVPGRVAAPQGSMGPMRRSWLQAALCRHSTGRTESKAFWLPPEGIPG